MQSTRTFSESPLPLPAFASRPRERAGEDISSSLSRAPRERAGVRAPDLPSSPPPDLATPHSPLASPSLLNSLFTALQNPVLTIVGIADELDLGIPERDWWQEQKFRER